MLTILILGSLATWRLTHMLMVETGPLAIFEKLQAKINRLDFTTGGIRDGFNCFMCLSIWVAILLVGLYLLSTIAFYIVTLVLALSAVSVFIDAFKDRLR